MKSKLRMQTLVLGCLLFAFAGCSSAPPAGGGDAGGAPGAGGGTGAGGGGGAAARAGVISPDDKPLDVLTKAIRAQLDAKSYRARMEMSASPGGASKMLVEYASPDRYHVVRDATAGEPNSRLEYIIIGKETHVKAGDGPWTKFPADMGSMINSLRDPKIVEELTKGADMKFVGPDTLDGEPMLVYQYTLDNVGGLAVKSVTKTWVSIADGLPRKSESDGEFQGNKTKTVARMSDYNADIKIELPAK